MCLLSQNHGNRKGKVRFRFMKSIYPGSCFRKRRCHYSHLHLLGRSVRKSSRIIHDDSFPRRYVPKLSNYCKLGLNRLANEPLFTPESMWYYKQNESQFSLSIESSLIIRYFNSADVTPSLNESNRCTNKCLCVKLETYCWSVLQYLFRRLKHRLSSRLVKGLFAGVGGN